MIRKAILATLREMARPLIRQIWKEVRVEILTAAARTDNNIDNVAADHVVRAIDKVLNGRRSKHDPD